MTRVDHVDAARAAGRATSTTTVRPRSSAARDDDARPQRTHGPTPREHSPHDAEHRVRGPRRGRDRRPHRQPGPAAPDPPRRLRRARPPRDRHRPRPGHGRRPEGRQRPPGHGDEHGPDRLPALPEVAAARPERPELGRPRPVRALDGPLEPDPLRPALPLRLRPGARRPARRCAPGARRPPATPRSTTPPASRPRPARWARASATPSAWRWPPAASAACSTPTPPRARACSTTPSGPSPPTATWRRASAARRPPWPAPSSWATWSSSTTTTRSPSRTTPNVAFTEDVGKRYEAYGWHVQHVDDGEDLAAVDAAFAAAKAETGRPSIIVLQHDHRLARARTSRTPAPRTARRSARTRSRPPRRSSASTRRRPSTSPPEVIEHARKVVARGQKAHAAWQERFDAWKKSNPDGAALLERMTHPHPARGLGREAAELGRRPEGRRHPQGLRRGARRALPGAARAVGRLGRPGGEQQHRGEGRTVVPARRPPDEDVVRRPLRPHAALRRPRARHGLDHERHRPARRHPRLRRHVPHVLRLHARRGPAGRAHAAAGHLRVDPRLDRPGRGRPDPPADRALRRAAGHPRPGLRPPGRRQRDRRRLADDPREQRPAGRPGRCRGRTCRSSTATRVRLGRGRRPRRRTCWPRPRPAPPR